MSSRPPRPTSSFCIFVSRPYPTRVKGTHPLGRDGEPWSEFAAEASPATKSLWSKIATARPAKRSIPRIRAGRPLQVDMRKRLGSIHQRLAPWSRMITNDIKNGSSSPLLPVLIPGSEPRSRPIARRSRQGDGVVSRNGQACLGFGFDLSLFAHCTSSHWIALGARILTMSRDRREDRKAKGSRPSRQHRAFVNSALHIICDRFQRSAIKASKKSAYTESIRLQHHYIRLCAISLLIVNTWPNDNSLRLREPSGIDRRPRSSQNGGPATLGPTHLSAAPWPCLPPQRDEARVRSRISARLSSHRS